MPTKPKKKSAPSIKPTDAGDDPKAYAPTGEEAEVQQFLINRIDLLKDVRKKRLPGITQSAEDIWAAVDREFTPHELGTSEQRKRFELDEDNGLRSRMVKVGDTDNWQSDSADPVFYVKVTTALSILVEQNPEAVFMPAASRYQKTTDIAYANWKASWENSNGKQQAKLFIFNQAKYGTAYGKTYPKQLVVNKTIQTEYNSTDPSKNKFVTKQIVKYNDLCRRTLNPWRVWLSENARPGDPLSIDDWYHEDDYSWEQLQEEFKDNANLQYIAKGAIEPSKNGEDKPQTVMLDNVTVGFYENQRKDKYAIWVPSQHVLLYHSPLPNDDGLLNLWTAPWSLRHDESHIGIGIYEIIRQDAATYDRMKNMTVDQVTLMIYKMFFHKGLDQLGQNGQLRVSPGVGEQVADPQSIKFLEVPGPGPEAWKGIEFLRDKVDTNSGVPQQLTGKFSGNTLGQDMQAKEIALQRMKAPLDYLLDALQQEGYISLSWLKQLLSVPEVLEWTDMEDLSAALKEMGVSDEDIKKYTDSAQSQNPDPNLLYQGEQQTDEAGLPTADAPKKYVNVFREISLGLEQDKNGEVTPSDKTKFYRFGLHIPLDHLEWKGMIRIKPQSVLAPSKEAEKENDLKLFNLVFPSIQSMSANPMLVPVLMAPIKQIVRAFDKDPNEWVNAQYFEKLYQDAQQPKAPPPPEVKTSLAVSYKDIIGMPDAVQSQILEKFLGVKVEPPLLVDKGTGAPVPGTHKVSSIAPPGAPSTGRPPDGTLTPNSAPQDSPAEAAPAIEPVAPMPHGL